MLQVALGAAALVGWVALEFVVRRPGEASTLTGASEDRLSTPLLVVGYIVAVVTPVALGPTGLGGAGDAAWLGVAMGLLGLALRVWAMNTLGSSYSRTLRVQAAQRLITSGPYRWLRHPGYAGSLAVWVGATLAFGTWLGALVVAVVMLAAYGWRIRGEEAMLSATFGTAYEEYASHTSRLIPGIY